MELWAKGHTRSRPKKAAALPSPFASVHSIWEPGSVPSLCSPLPLMCDLMILMFACECACVRLSDSQIRSHVCRCGGVQGAPTSQRATSSLCFIDRQKFNSMGARGGRLLASAASAPPAAGPWGLGGGNRDTVIVQSASKEQHPPVDMHGEIIQLHAPRLLNAVLLDPCSMLPHKLIPHPPARLTSKVYSYVLSASFLAPRCLGCWRRTCISCAYYNFQSARLAGCQRANAHNVHDVQNAHNAVAHGYRSCTSMASQAEFPRAPQTFRRLSC